MLVMISGPSGAGKNTIIEILKKRNSDINFLKSCTTRPPRDIEQEKNYIHLSKEEMEEKIANGDLFEYERIHDNVYGTLLDTVNEVITNDGIYIKDFGVIGQKFFKEQLKGKTKLLSVFLDCDINELKKRLVERGEKEIEKRMSRRDFEVSQKSNFDIVIDNYDMMKTVETIEKEIKKRLN